MVIDTLSNCRIARRGLVSPENITTTRPPHYRQSIATWKISSSLPNSHAFFAKKQRGKARLPQKIGSRPETALSVTARENEAVSGRRRTHVEQKCT